MQDDTMLENVNVRRENAGNRQCTQKKMRGIGNTRKGNTWNRQCVWKNARNRKYTQRKHLESTMCAERTLEITYTCKENTWNHEN